MSDLGSIPRKKLAPLPPPPPQPPAYAAAAEEEDDYDDPPPVIVKKKKKKRHLQPIAFVSEFPMVLRIKTTDVPLIEGLPEARTRVKNKQKIGVYQEQPETDSDDLMDTDEEEALPASAKVQAQQQQQDSELTPPPGMLSTLWYSTEALLHLWVLEKVVGWKTRTAVQLVDATTGEPVTLDPAEATTLQQKALWNVDFWNASRKRNEVSRIVTNKCPVILALAAETNPAYKLQTVGREDVLLVKWRGRSHLHCSWERASDIQRLDANNTAHNKIKRFYQQQEITYGSEWKQVLEEERTTAKTIHAHGGATAVDTDDDANVGDEDYFSPQCLEVERIVACDEAEMNMQLFAKQRALNQKAEQDALRLKEKEDGVGEEDDKHHGLQHLIRDLMPLPDAVPWDPEDNVRYVVKWKGLPYAEMTWEYWRDIKRDAVDEAEDFWYRQSPGDVDKLLKLAKKPHPHVRDFRKLKESPEYGISTRERPVALLDSSKSTTTSVDEDDATSGFKLRSYQLEGVNWLLFNWFNKRSCILADEMGLGKTIQTAAFLKELHTQPASQVLGPFLIVAPLSLIGQWQSELHSWVPDMNVVFYHGSADARDFLVKNEFYYTEQFVQKPTAVKLKKHHVTKFQVLITTYEVVLKDIQVLSKIKWRTLIVDEAHRLKNPRARLFEELATVPREYCVLLTGTPIANATEELWALLNFANPHVFNDKDGFLEKFGEMTDSKQVNELHTLLKPYLLRRVKEDVEKSLPPKEETILEVSLTPIQKTFYKAIYERNTSFLYKGAKPSNAPSLMNVMMELRKCCNHPYLVRGAEERILADAAAKLKERKDEHGNEIPIDQNALFADQLVKSSGKMVLMEKLLHKLFQDGHKVLIFSQMVRALDLLEELLRIKKYRYERLDGSTSSSARAHAVDRFNRKSMQRFVMLLSTRAGGLGLNLTAADIVIIFDSDFNPQNDLQAMARAHRIGQTRAVQVFRLLTAKTYEMHMFHSASMKLGLERAVLSQNRDQGEESDDVKTKNKSERELQAKEIDELLKKGAYDVFRDEDDKEAEQFMETDIDQLLKHSSKKVTYGAEATSSLGSGLGSFSKASFVANTEEGEKDVDLDDPDFWSKAVGLTAPEELPDEIAAMLDDGVKRQRKQVQVYDPYAESAEAEKMKKERLALEKMLEKEEKERLKEEKKKKKKEAKEKKKKDVDEKQQSQKNAPLQLPKKNPKEGDQAKKISKEGKPKKSKKSDRQLALRRAENEDPVMERLKQAWEVPQRTKATAAIVRFGFMRFCKIRNESNLTSLPLQDVENFVRSFLFQLALQVAVILLGRLNDNPDVNDLRPMFREWLGLRCPSEVDWICDAIENAMKMQLDVESRRRFLRMPVILAEPAYVGVLRQGAAFRALRRIGLLARLNRLIESCVDSILGDLGHEELGKRGCPANDLPDLDVDLKARYVTTEEISLAIGSRFRKLNTRIPVAWWDRSCDVALVVGTFVHGLGNYEAMRNDHDLPFSDKLKRAADEDEVCSSAAHIFRAASHATRLVFDDALEATRIKAELEVQAAVAAAAAAASKREEDAAVLREGGEKAEKVASTMPDTQVADAFEFDGTDSHFVTLQRMYKYVRKALKREGSVKTRTASTTFSTDDAPESVKSADDDGEYQLEEFSGRIREHQRLPMPDARILDYRLMLILNEIEVFLNGEDLPDAEESNPDMWRKTDDVLTNIQVRARGLEIFFVDPEERINEYSGVGIGGFQCGTSHRTLNDGSDFGFGSASPQLSQVAYGTDAPRYLRALGVPMNITRFAVSALVYTQESWVERLLETDRLQYYGDKNAKRKVKTTKDAPKSVPDGQKSASPSPKAGSPTPEKTAGEVDPKAAEEAVEHVDPVTLIPPEFRENAQLRAYVCVALLYYGSPAASSGTKTVQNDIWELYVRQNGRENVSNPSLFTDEDFRNVVTELAPDLEVPDAASLRNYVETILLPHCVRLCVNGNGPTTRGARGSQGEYETAFGVSLHPEPSESHPSPLPDPCLTNQEHSLEALGAANAILRRVRLLRACHYVCGGDVSSREIEALLRSAMLSTSRYMPVWWCPWKHDLSLLIEAATKGLFSVIPNRSVSASFSPDAVQRSLRSSLTNGQNASKEIRRTATEALDMWAARQAEKFPSLYQLERRLGFLCSQATVDVDGEARFDIIPMWDHGAWPRI